MNRTTASVAPEPARGSSPTPVWKQRATLQSAAYVVVLLCGAWWLLGQWATLLRPLLLAIFLGYVLMPWYTRLRRAGLPAPLVIVGLGGLAAVLLITIAQIAYSSVRELRQELPMLQVRLTNLSEDVIGTLRSRAPWLPLPGGAAGDVMGDELNAAASSLVSMGANAVLEAAATALYLLFILLGAEKLPGRVRMAYPGEEGERILDVAGGINAAIIAYLRAKFLSSALMAGAAGIVLAVFGVKFVAVWMLLTFLCNFIPYIGSVVAFALPTAYAALQLPPWTEPITVALLLLAVQVISATLVEPMLIGRAVGLSPLLILAALAIWGTLWGLPGMFLAVPLTVVLKIVLKNIEGTKPLARLAGD